MVQVYTDKLLKFFLQFYQAALAAKKPRSCEAAALAAKKPMSQQAAVLAAANHTWIAKSISRLSALTSSPRASPERHQAARMAATKHKATIAAAQQKIGETAALKKAEAAEERDSHHMHVFYVCQAQVLNPVYDTCVWTPNRVWISFFVGQSLLS